MLTMTLYFIVLKQHWYEIEMWNCMTTKIQLVSWIQRFHFVYNLFFCSESSDNLSIINPKVNLAILYLACALNITLRHLGAQQKAYSVVKCFLLCQHLWNSKELLPIIFIGWHPFLLSFLDIQSPWNPLPPPQDLPPLFPLPVSSFQPTPNGPK